MTLTITIKNSAINDDENCPMGSAAQDIADHLNAVATMIGDGEYKGAIADPETGETIGTFEVKGEA